MKEKLIGGVPHVQRKCAGCKELIWVGKKGPKDLEFVCDTCLKSKTDFSCQTGGGIRVIKKAEPFT